MPRSTMGDKTPRTAPLDHPLPGGVEGPWLQSLTARLLRVPDDFLAHDVVTRAIVNDTLDLLGSSPCHDWTSIDSADLPSRLATQVGCWLVTDPELSRIVGLQPGDQVVRSLATFATLVAAVPLRSWFGDDPERHEEVVRALLRALRIRPGGESHDVAEDAWVSISSSVREGALRLAAVEQLQAAELARRLAEQRAREAAAQYTHV